MSEASVFHRKASFTTSHVCMFEKHEMGRGLCRSREVRKEEEEEKGGE